MKAKVSIIIPIFNAQNYLNKCITSVVNQTEKRIEIILVDDESTDDSGKMCDAWAEKDERIKVLHIKNKGVSNARNKGLEIASCSFVMFADSDDWMKSEMVEILLNQMETNCLDAAFCDYKKVVGENYTDCDKVIEYKCYAEMEISTVVRNMFGGGKYFASIWRGIYRKETIDIYKIRFTNIKFAEDMLFNIEFLLNSRRIALIENKLYFYRENPTSALQRLKNNLDEMQKLPYNVYQLLMKYQKMEEYLKSFENELQLTIQRMFLIDYSYKNFKKNAKTFRDKYLDMFDTVDGKSKIVCLCKKEKWVGLYTLLFAEKIKKKVKKK